VDREARALLAELDARYTPDACMVWDITHSPGYHTRIPDGTKTHSTRRALDYAVLLLDSGEPERRARAAQVIAKVLTLQEPEPTNRTYGIWPWFLEESLAQMSPPDWNWADFCGARLAEILIRHAEHLPPPLVEQVRTALGHAGWSIFRRNVGPGYTNISIMGGGVTLLAGEILDEPRLLDYGRRRLKDQLAHTAFHGSFNEYNSPTYTLVALDECERILELARDEAARAHAEALRRHAWQVIAEHWHPATSQWAGPHSRAYSDRLQEKSRERIARRTHPPFDALSCPEEFRARFECLPEPEFAVRRRFIGHEDETRSTYGTTWFGGDACLASVNQETFWTQRRVLLGYWKTTAEPAVVLRLRFLHDGRDFASACVWNAQEGPRVLSAVGLVLNQGDFHPNLDRPERPCFTATDLRLRCELSGRGVSVEPLGAGRYALRAGGHRAVLHTTPGLFGDREVRWETGGDADRVFLDGVCHAGPATVFDLARVEEIRIVLGLELRSESQPASAAPISVVTRPDGMREAHWPEAPALRLEVPRQAVPAL
jgi:hypothetical protein